MVNIINIKMTSFSRNKYDSLHIKNNIYSEHGKKKYINVSVNYPNLGDLFQVQLNPDCQCHVYDMQLLIQI